MRLTMEEWVDKYHSYNGEETLVETHTVESDSLLHCFQKMYPFQRALRYCNGYYLKATDEEVQDKWLDFLHNGVTMEMYYGNATVD